jgi:hypothetical protein
MPTPNLSPDLKKAIVEAVKSTATRMSEAGPSKAVQEMAAKATTPSKTALSNILSKATTLLNKSAPDLLSLVPGVGPALKMVATTLNDDEWFEEFKGVGVTPNEFLQLNTYDDGKTYNPVSALTECICSINDSQSFLDNFMPTILAYVRNHTNNVLTDDTSLYATAFLAASRLYAHYYAGLKLIKLSEHQPLNIPLLNKLVGPIDPSEYSRFKGAIEALGDFLKSTIRLPYAWCEYLRWRFGTTFYSENTGKPGLIMYNPRIITTTKYRTADTIVSNYITAIDDLRAAYISAGRAGADLKLAYDTHQIRYDVEDAHYDAKEFNLRCNLTVGTITENPKRPADAGEALVFLDSRLDQQAAVQAVTISTRTGIEPITVTNIILACYVPKELNMWYGRRYGTLNGGGRFERYTVAIEPGWHAFQSLSASVAMYTSGIYRMPVLVGGDAPGLPADDGPFHFYDGSLFRGSPLPNGEILPPIFESGSDTYAAFWFAADHFGEEGNRINTYDRLTNDLLQELILGYYLSAPLLTSLQFHNTGVTERICGTLIASTPLAYDTAYVSVATLQAIQRTAIRNLVRGEYRAKKQATTRPDVKEAVAAVETAAVQDIKNQME